jgi:hypothetical protein
MVKKPGDLSENRTGFSAGIVIFATHFVPNPGKTHNII